MKSYRHAHLTNHSYFDHGKTPNTLNHAIRAPGKSEGSSQRLNVQ